MEPVSDQTRGAVWGALYDLERNARYYAAMADRHKFRHRVLRFAILAGALSEAGILYAATVHGWLFYAGAAGGLLLAALTIWDAVSDYAEHAAVLRITALVCDDLKQEAEALWRSVEDYRVSPRDAEGALASIIARWSAATQRVQTRTNDQLNRQTSLDARQYMTDRYAVQPS